MLLLNKRHMGTKLVYLRGLFLCFWWGTMLCVESTMRYPSSLNLVLILPRHVSFMYPSSILPNFCSSVMCVSILVPLLQSCNIFCTQFPVFGFRPTYFSPLICGINYGLRYFIYDKNEQNLPYNVKLLKLLNKIYLTMSNY